MNQLFFSLFILVSTVFAHAGLYNAVEMNHTKSVKKSFLQSNGVLFAECKKNGCDTGFSIPCPYFGEEVEISFMVSPKEGCLFVSVAQNDNSYGVVGYKSKKICEGAGWQKLTAKAFLREGACSDYNYEAVVRAAPNASFFINQGSIYKN